MTKRIKSPPLIDLRKRAEDRLVQSPVVTAPPSVDQQRLLHELTVHQVELEMQNDQLRQVQTELEQSLELYADLFDFAPVGYLTLASTGTIEEINHTAAALLGLNRENLLHRTFSNWMPKDSKANWNGFFESVKRDPYFKRHTTEINLNRPDGTVFCAQLNCARAISERTDGRVRLSFVDVSVRKLAEMEQRIAAIAFESQEGMILTDAHGIIIRVNKAFTDLTGYSAAEAIGQRPAMLHSGQHSADFYRRMWATLRTDHYWQGEIWNRRKNGSLYVEWLTISVVTTEDGEISHYVGAFSEITQHKEAQAQIHRMAYYDSLTELPNRRMLLDRLELVMASTARNGSHGAILFLDLDNFKQLNDTQGHSAGDQLLTEVAQRLRLCVREVDMVGRLGGDEFVVILADLDKDAETAGLQARHLGEKVRVELVSPFHPNGLEYFTSASIGISLFMNHDQSADDLFRQSDLALYQAKEAGRNVVKFFDPVMQATLDRYVATKNDLSQAIERHELHLYYQPQTNAARQIVGAEALLRWKHPVRGMVMPGDFISLAEKSGLIIPIGTWVMAEACRQLKLWSAAPQTQDLTLSVNVSILQFHQPGYVAEVREILEQSGANPARLKIELTESLMIEDVQGTVQKLTALKALGIAIAMDDFGTGYSSLSSLTLFPLDQLKIDQSFVVNLPQGHHDAILANTIIQMGTSLGMGVIAEGVETEAQWDFLMENGCRDFQGYLFKPPMPLGLFEECINAQGAL